MTEEEKVFEFDAEFQEQIVALALRDSKFSQQVEGLIEPFYFTNEADAVVYKIASDYWASFRVAPAPAVWPQMIKDAVASKIISKAQLPDVVAKIKTVGTMKISDREFVVNKVDEFARNQAWELGILKCAELVESGKFEEIAKIVGECQLVGASKEDFDYDYFENSSQRLNRRRAVMAGEIAPTGVTTGLRDMDDRLYQKGWGKQELSVIAGAAKSGKSMSLITFAVNANRVGFDVLFISLEVSTAIVSDRIDANISQIPMNSLMDRMAVVHGKVDALSKSGAGKMHVVGYPSGTFSPNDLRRLLAKQRARGHEYDLVVIDYLDIMRPDIRTNDAIENSKSIWIDVRAIMQEWDTAGLTATQLNREGFKAAVGRMEHVSDDINKVRTADQMISLNSTEAEKALGEARFYFAASRNCESDFSLRVKTARDQSNMLTRFVAIE